MIRSFVLYVYPAIPSKLGHGSYAVATSHAVVGDSAWFWGCSSSCAPTRSPCRSRLRFTNYKRVHAQLYALYMLGTATGVSLYVVAYVAGWT